MRGDCPFRFGDLVQTNDGYYGLIVDPLPGYNTVKVAVAVSNGTEMEIGWNTLTPLPLMPGAASAANFAEWLVMRRT